MLIGRFDARLSRKQQVVFPKEFRNTLGDRLILTKGFDQNLLIVSHNNWEALLEGTKNSIFLSKRVREIQRFLLGNATEITLDTFGRFVIPDYLREAANIKENIVFAGIRKYVEIWDRKMWEDNQKFLSLTAHTIAEKLNELFEGRKEE